jgi:phosphoribosylformylglycinamidine synthase
MAILREQGVNGQLEMAAAFDRAGFECIDIHMQDLIDKRINLDSFNGLVACGGFSYGDVLGAGGGWAKTILYNHNLTKMFESFFNRTNTFSLGVCNGCQMMSQLRDLIPGAASWPDFSRNQSEQFEARLVMVEIIESPSLLLRDMAGSKIPVVVAHGEGRVSGKNTYENKVMRYIDNSGNTTETYPLNPNGSPDGLTGFTNDDGRITIMMPHPERIFLRKQFSYLPSSWNNEYSPWMKIFLNARQWLE